MTRALKFYPEAKTDISHGKKWYKQQQIGLDKRFANEVKIAIEKIKEGPLYYEVRYRDVRLKHLNVFPYSVHYVFNEVEYNIIIIGIWHQHQSPDAYNSRQIYKI